MTAPPTRHWDLPAKGDIVISLDSSARNPSYALSVVPGPEQIRCQTYELALSAASRWAVQRRVSVWRTEDGRTFTLVAFTAGAHSPQSEERARHAE